jgi:hypothetical protein
MGHNCPKYPLDDFLGVQVREQLTQKINEEMFPVVQVTAPPARGFFRRLFDGLG